MYFCYNYPSGGLAAPIPTYQPAWIKAVAETDQDFEEQIADMNRRAGRNSGVSEGLRQYLADCRHRLELDLQEADYRLTIYRNIVLRPDIIHQFFPC